MRETTINAMKLFLKIIEISLIIAITLGCALSKVTPTSPPMLLASPRVNTPLPTAIPAQPTPTVKPTPADMSLGDTWTRPTDNSVMVYVPGGEFGMGITNDQIKYSVQLCNETDARIFGDNVLCFSSNFADEKPAHEVILDSFLIDRLEVTNKQYKRCVEAGICTPPTESGSYTRDTYYSESAYENYPVIWVGWEQATNYCNWVGARLPTEAEWEYAARGPENRIFPWGNTFDGTRLNYCDINCELGIADNTFDDGYPDTAPVGSFPSGISWCGALDMAGNVREWVSDWYGPYRRDQQVNPDGPPSGELLVSRGGSWYDLSYNVRSVKRGQNAPDFSAYKLGFRCARE